MPARTLGLVHLRASQIKGGAQAGETEQRLFALALTEAVTPLSDRADPVPDAIWDEAAKETPAGKVAAPLILLGIVMASWGLRPESRTFSVGAQRP